jgi:hypothetical protein
MSVPVALDEAGWKKAGVLPGSLRPVPNAAGLKQGVLPLLRLGAFEVPRVPGVSGAKGAPVADFEKHLDIELDGLVGSGLLAAFRVTLVDGGRTMWLEDIPAEAVTRGPRAPELPENVDPEDAEEPASDEAPPSAPRDDRKPKLDRASPPKPPAASKPGNRVPPSSAPGGAAPGPGAGPASGVAPGAGKSSAGGPSSRR